MAIEVTRLSLAFSADPEQQYLYVINQNSVQIEVYDRLSGEMVTKFGNGPGRYRGQFELPHGIGVDSEGNVIIAEQEGTSSTEIQLCWFDALNQ